MNEELDDEHITLDEDFITTTWTAMATLSHLTNEIVNANMYAYENAREHEHQRVHQDECERKTNINSNGQSRHCTRPPYIHAWR
jgi:hypothetical protein